MIQVFGLKGKAQTQTLWKEDFGWKADEMMKGFGKHCALVPEHDSVDLYKTVIFP